MGDSSPLLLTPDDVKNTIKLDSYRWVTVIIFGISCGINFFQFLQFTIIANITQRYYHVSSTMVSATGLVFMACFILFFIPAGHFTERYSLKGAAIISTSLTTIGNLLKLFAVSPNSFFLILISQSFCGTAQVILISMPSKVACTWFGPEEVSTACALGLMLGQIGLALGSLAPTMFVPDSQSMKAIANGFTNLFTFNIIISIAILIIILIFFRSEPECPPSHSQAALSVRGQEDKVNCVQAFKEFLTNKDYLMVVLCFGMSFGMWNGFGVVVNEIYLHYFPNNGKTLGVLILVAIISGGIFGTILFGYILDKTHEFKKVSFCVLILTVISWVLCIITFESRSFIGTNISITLYGFFSGSLLLLGFEYAIESTYPTPEPYGASTLNATINIFAVIYVLTMEFIIKTVGYLPGLILVLAVYAIAILALFLISPELKRRTANLIQNCDNYGSINK